MSLDHDASSDARTTHAATQTFGLALLAATLVAAVALSLIFFEPAEAVVFAVPGLLAFAGAMATRRVDRQWARWLGIAASVIGLVGFFLAFGIFQPFSPIEFVFGVAYVLGFFFSLVGGIRALRAFRRGATEPSGAHTRMQKLVLAGVAALSVISVVGFFATKQTVSEADAAGAIVLDMVDFEFDPISLAVPAGGKLLIKNSDPFVHDFKFEELGIKIVLGPGSEKLVDLSELEAGPYDYFCSLHSDGTSGMAGSFTIGG
jgi:plastocyanin